MATTRKQHRSWPRSITRTNPAVSQISYDVAVRTLRHVTVTDHHARCLGVSGRAPSRPSATNARHINEIEALA
jgi:hypothetical protein